MTDPFDSKTATALDRYTVPAMSADFADNVLAKALAKPTNPPTNAVLRDRRGGWKRVRNVAIGVGAFGLMSAAAAATGAFGDIAKDVPVIGTLIARIAPAKPKPKPTLSAPAKPLPKAKEPLLAPPEADLAAQDAIAPAVRVQAETLGDTRRAQREARLNERIDKIQTRRALAGLAPLPENHVRRLAKLSFLPRETRESLKANIADRLEAAQTAGPLDRATKRAIIEEETRSALRQQTKARQSRLKAEWEALSPEERESLLQRADERIKSADEAGEGAVITRRSAIIEELRARRRPLPADSQTPSPTEF